MEKKVPIRQCIGCRERKAKKELSRIIRTPDGQILFDSTGKLSGRGAYLCPSKTCFEKAIKTKALQRALECEIPEELFLQLRDIFIE